MSSSAAPDSGAPAGAPTTPPLRQRGFVSRWLRRLARGAIYALACVVVLVTGIAIWVLFFFPNGLVVGQAVRIAGEMGVDLSIGSLDVEPLSGVRIDKVVVDVPANQALGIPPLVSVERVDVRWDLRAAIRDRRVHVSSIDVESPRLRLDGSGGTWNVLRVLAALVPPPASPAPSPTPEPAPAPAVPIEEQLAAQVAVVDSMLALVPVPVDLDRLRVTGLSLEVGDDRGTFARVSGIGVEIAAHLSPGAGTVTVTLDAAPGIAIAAQPGGESGFSGVFAPAVSVTVDLPREVALTADVTLADAVVVAPGLELPLTAAGTGTGSVDLLAGDLALRAEKVDVGGFLDAGGSLEVDGLGVKGIRGRWAGTLRSRNLPERVSGELFKATQAKSLHAGGTLQGSLDGTLETADPARIAALLGKKRLPLTLSLRSEGASEEGLLALEGLSIGRLSHRASVEVTPDRIALDADAEIARVVMAPLLDGKPFTIALSGQLEVPSSFDAIRVSKAALALPEARLSLEGRAKLSGLTAALGAFTRASAKNPDTIAAALAAITVLREIDAGGTFRFSSPQEEVELATDAFLVGSMVAGGSLVRRADPYGTLRGEVVYQDFGARIANPPPAAPKKGETPKPEERPKKPLPPDALVVRGMNATLRLERELILGGRPKEVTADEEIAADEASVFDPATRGYYDRLGSLRAAADNFRIARVLAPPLEITDLSAEVSYEGGAIRVNRGRMQLLGGEVVGRAILRPTAEGLNVALSGDLSGIDFSPLILEKPLEDPDDSRIHLSSAASFFLSKDDPVASLADMRMRVDATAAGSKVLDTLLAWLDPEFKDPMFNWARSVNKKVVGVTRPQFTAMADHGMYDVTVGFPSLGVSKDVKRIPLRPLLNLKFTREITGALAPPGELLPYLAARGVDQDGNVVLPVVRPELER